MEYWFIYLLQLFENFELLLIISGCSFIISIVAFVLCFVGEECSYSSEESKRLKLAKETLKKFSIAFACIWLFLLFVPSRNTLLLMGGVYLGKKAINVVVTDEKIKKVNQIIELELDKKIGELKKNANNVDSTNKQEI